MHLFGHTFDHDYYFELPREGERDTQSIAMSRLSRVSTRACGPQNLMKISSSECRIVQARSGEIEFALEKLRLSACLIRSVRG